MVVKDAKATLTYSVTNVDASAVSPVQITTNVKAQLSSKTTAVKNAVAAVGTIDTCCQTSTTATTVVEEKPKVAATDAKDKAGGLKMPDKAKEEAAAGAAAATETKVEGSMTVDVTLPTGQTLAAFIADADVKKGFEKGIATHLGVDATQVKCTLSAA